MNECVQSRSTLQPWTVYRFGRSNERSASTSWLDEAEMSSRLASSHVGSFESDQNLVGGRHGGARGKMTDDVQEMAISG